MVWESSTSLASQASSFWVGLQKVLPLFDAFSLLNSGMVHHFAFGWTTSLDRGGFTWLVWPST